MSELATVEKVPVWRPGATDLVFVLASGCDAVSTFLAESSTVEVRPPRGDRYKAAGAE